MNPVRLFNMCVVAAVTVAALVASAGAQSTRGQSSESTRQAPALAPDGIDATAKVEVRQSESGFEMKIGEGLIRSASWIEIEKKAIELLPGRTISFVTPAGELLHVSPRAMIGVLLEPASGALAAQLDVKPGAALIVTEVQPGLPAARAGLEVYDVIVECNGKRPMTNVRFSEIIAAAVPGDTVNVVLVRRGRETEIEVRLDRYDPVAMAAVREPMGALGASKTREQVLRELIQSTGGGTGQSGTVALPRNSPPGAVLPVPELSPRFPDPNTQALREELDGIRRQLRRIEEVLLDLLQLEEQRQPAPGRSVGG